MLYWIVCNLLHLFLRVWNRLAISGKEHVPLEGGCIVVSNHASFLDPPILGAAVKPRALNFLARDSLFRFPPFGWLLKKLRAIPMDRTRGDFSALRTAIRKVKGDKCIAMFPEGTRSLDGELSEAKGGIGFLIKKAGVPVLPVYIDGSYAAMSKGCRIVKPHRIRVLLGKPVSLDELQEIGSVMKGYREIGDYVMSRVGELKNELLS